MSGMSERNGVTEENRFSGTQRSFEWESQWKDLGSEKESGESIYMEQPLERTRKRMVVSN